MGKTETLGNTAAGIQAIVVHLHMELCIPRRNGERGAVAAKPRVRNSARGSTPNLAYGTIHTDP